MFSKGKDLAKKNVFLVFSTSENFTGHLGSVFGKVDQEVNTDGGQILVYLRLVSKQNGFKDDF